jgi:hypothetical protein
MMRLIAAGMLTLAAATGVATAEKPPFKLPAGRVYVFHSGPTSGCPGVDWYIVAEPGDILTGFIAWNHMRSLARATGTLSRRAGTFEMTAHEVGGRTELSLSPERLVRQQFSFWPDALLRLRAQHFYPSLMVPTEAGG